MDGGAWSPPLCYRWGDWVMERLEACPRSVPYLAAEWSGDFGEGSSFRIWGIIWDSQWVTIDSLTSPQWNLASPWIHICHFTLAFVKYGCRHLSKLEPLPWSEHCRKEIICRSAAGMLVVSYGWRLTTELCLFVIILMGCQLCSLRVAGSVVVHGSSTGIQLGDWVRIFLIRKLNLEFRHVEE